MNNTDKLLRAFNEASGYEIEELVDTKQTPISKQSGFNRITSSAITMKNSSLVVESDLTNKNVTKNEQFIVRGNVTCVGGPCGNVELSLDPEEQGLIGLWTIDEGSGTSIRDGSGNSNDGTRIGTSWIT